MITHSKETIPDFPLQVPWTDRQPVRNRPLQHKGTEHKGRASQITWKAWLEQPTLHNVQVKDRQDLSQPYDGKVLLYSIKVSIQCRSIAFSKVFLTLENWGFFVLVDSNNDLRTTSRITTLFTYSFSVPHHQRLHTPTRTLSDAIEIRQTQNRKKEKRWRRSETTKGEITHQQMKERDRQKDRHMNW